MAEPAPAPAALPRWVRPFAYGVLATFLACAALGLEWYPFTGWRLFAQARQAPRIEVLRAPEAASRAELLRRAQRRLDHLPVRDALDATCREALEGVPAGDAEVRYVDETGAAGLRVACEKAP